MIISESKQLTKTWDEVHLDWLHSEIVTEILRCDTEHSKRAAIEYVKILNHIGLNEENYPFFMELFLHEDKELIRVLLGDGRIFRNLLKLQRSSQLIELCFKLLERFTRTDVFEKTLETLFTLLKRNYHDPNSGYWIFALSNHHLNQMGKFLDKEKSQSQRLNRLILDILGDLGDINSKDHVDPALLEISSRANKIRNVFFDSRASMSSVIPEKVLLQKI